MSVSYKEVKKTIKTENLEKFELFATWYSLPRGLLRNKSRDEIIERIGVDEEYLIDLLKIKTASEFSDLYGISNQALTDWAKKLSECGQLELIQLWGRKVTKNVSLGIYNSGMKGNHANAKLWLQSVEDFVEKTENEVKTPLPVTVNIIQKDAGNNNP